jgi:peroxiredoxin
LTISICQRLGSSVTRENQWQGFTLMAMDGSSVHLMDTEVNQLLYLQPSVQKKVCGFRTMSISF